MPEVLVPFTQVHVYLSNILDSFDIWLLVYIILKAEHPELKRKRREAGLASTDDIQLQLLEIVNSVSNTVSNKKVSGEG